MARICILNVFPKFMYLLRDNKNMNKLLKVIVIILILTFITPLSHAQGKFTANKNTAVFIDEMAKKHGFSKTTLRSYFAKAKYTGGSVHFSRRPAEAANWKTYKKNVVSDKKIADGVKFYKNFKNTLAKAQRKYGVPSYIIAGILGVESDYGKTVMKYRAFDALATLGFSNSRRAKYFRSELEALLLLARKTKTDPFYYKSSYAGAVGIPQFMPSNILKYAVDGSGNGNIDIVNNMTDAIFSVGNYLKKFGWQTNKPVAVKVTVKGSKYKSYLKKSPCGSKKTTVGALKKAGVVFPMSFNNNTRAALFSVDIGGGKSEYHVGFDNFCVLTRYNSSISYVLAVNYLGNIIGMKVGAVKKRR